MKRLVWSLILVLCFHAAAPLGVPGNTINTAYANSSSPLTPLAIITVANKLLGDLNSLAGSLTGDALIVVNQFSGELSARIEELRKLVKEDLNKPLESFSLNIQNLGRQLDSAIKQINFMLANQQICFFRNIEITLSGLANLAQDLKRGIPLVNSGDPRLSHYKFDGNLANTVPKDGGRLVVTGFKLWDHNELPPVVTLMSDDKKIADLKPRKANDSNSVSVTVDKSVIAQNTGKCLQLHVRAFTKRFLGGKKEFYMNLPFCVSLNYSVQFKVTAYVNSSYKAQPKDTDGPEMQFLYFNNSCESVMPVNDIRPVSMPGSGCSIVAFRTTFANSRNTTNMMTSIGPNNTMRASGTLDTASCADLLFGKKLLHSTFWENKVIPVIRCDVKPPDAIATSESQPANLEIPATVIKVKIPKSGETEKEVFWFTVKRIVNGVDTGVIYESQPVTTTGLPVDSAAAEKNEFLFVGSYNPSPINGYAHATVTIRAPTCNP